MDEILSKEKELHSLHQKIAQDEENLALVQNKNKELLRRIEFMKRMQLTGDKDKHKFPAQRSLSSSLDGRLGSKMHSELKLHRLHTVESISIIKHEGDIVEHHSNPIHEALHADLVSDSPDKGQNNEPSQASILETSITQWPGNEQDGGFKEEDQIEIARELVKKNRQIFELEQVGVYRNTGIAGVTGNHLMHKMHRNWRSHSALAPVSRDEDKSASGALAIFIKAPMCSVIANV